MAMSTTSVPFFKDTITVEVVEASTPGDLGLNRTIRSFAENHPVRLEQIQGTQEVIVTRANDGRFIRGLMR